ncbi:MAG TPA: DinB family protein [Bryobacteraceae bacterium]|nr:DinB family protein [Bryobacteraceae bacterium]
MASLIAYDYWANQESLESVRSAGGHVHAVSVLAHVAAVEDFWLARITGAPLPSTWPEWSIETVRGAMDSALAGWNRILDEVTSGARPDGFEYLNAVGKPSANSFGEVLVELVSHGAHHRGQVALLLRQAGHEPAKSTDFIPALRRLKF